MSGGGGQQGAWDGAFEAVAGEPADQISEGTTSGGAPNPPTNIVDFGGSDPSIISIQSGGILMCVEDFLESLSQAMRNVS